MSGSHDIDIWNKFQNNGSQAVIITRDHDFIALSEIFAMAAMLQQKTTQAVAIGNSPFVVHVNIHKNKKRDVIDTFKCSSQDFMKEAARPQRRMPYMRLNSQGIFAGPSLPEIFRRFTKHKGGYDPSSPIVNPEMVDFKKLDKLRRRYDVSAEQFSPLHALAT